MKVYLGSEVFTELQYQQEFRILANLAGPINARV